MTQTEQLDLTISGMSCASCVAHVEKAARTVAGVRSVSVNLATGRAAVALDPNTANSEQVASAITASGYPAHVRLKNVGSAPEGAESAWGRRAIVGLALWLPVEAAHWALHLSGHMRGMGTPRDVMMWAALITSTLSLAYVGRGFYASALRSARHRTSNMDTLIAMGASVAWGYSLVVLLGMWLWGWAAEPVYFMEASGLLALISLGHWMEARARASAGHAIRELLTLTPATALRLEGEDVPREIPASDIREGDRLLVRPGDRVAVDGVILAGRSAMDESMITGEPIPVPRGIGEDAIAGTISTDGRLTIRATRVGSDTTVAQIVKLVETAQSSKPPVQRLADQISAVFVPSVLGVAAITAIGWVIYGDCHGWSHGHIAAITANAVCSVLIIACPCALGLALPAAVMVGTGMGARRGILFRDVDVLQKAERLSVIALDKTGTITRGKPTVEAIEPREGISERELLALAASVEQYSGHPLAVAIVARARAEAATLSEPASFSSEAGLGVAAEIGQRSMLVGSEDLLVARGAEREDDAGGTVVKIAEVRDGVIRRLGRITFVDPIKAESASVARELKRMNLTAVLLTGDNLAAASSVAAAVGIDEVHAGVKPGGKAKVIDGLKVGRGKISVVAMVGDGINDAPALAAADVGIALGSGADVAKETAGIVLVGANLAGVVAAINLSRATMRIIRQNLFLAFVYNVLAIPLAALGLLNPLIAAAAMALSDVTVLLNALRLRRARIDPREPVEKHP